MALQCSLNLTQNLWKRLGFISGLTACYREQVQSCEVIIVRLRRREICLYVIVKFDRLWC
jgi:hypothetical protein